MANLPFRSLVVREVLRSNLPDPVKVLVVAMVEHADWTTGEGFCSQSTIAAAIGKSERTVRNLERTLAAANPAPVEVVRRHVAREAGRGRGSEYAVRLRDQPETTLPVEGTTNRKNSDVQPAESTPSTGKISTTNRKAGCRLSEDQIDQIDQIPPSPPEGDVRERARRYLRDEFGGRLEYGPAESWPEVLDVLRVWAEVWRPVTLRGGLKNPSLRAILERAEEGCSVDELTGAIRGSKLDEHIATHTQFQELQTVLRDVAQVEKFNRLLKCPPAPRGPVASRRNPAPQPPVIGQKLHVEEGLPPEPEPAEPPKAVNQ